MLRRPPRSTRTDTLFPYTTLFRSLDVAGGLQAAAQVGLHRAVERPALRVPEHRSGGLLLQVEEVHLPPEAPVVALLGLLQHGEVGLQPLLVLPAGAVDALELGIARVAAPVGTGDLGKLEGMAELACRGQMRDRKSGV